MNSENEQERYFVMVQVDEYAIINYLCASSGNRLRPVSLAEAKTLTEAGKTKDLPAVMGFSKRHVRADKWARVINRV